ncbi:hybrid sensor histidine kinase/response regulator, partial [Verminephrobacter sp. Larva24]
LTQALEATARSGEPPSAALAMEVATSVLYLQAAFEELDTADDQLEARATRLAERLHAVTAGAESEPLEHWMEELYRRVSDNQTMGSVVGELRATLAETEKALDQFFRNPKDRAVLATVPGHFAQMRGVLSVLGLEQASLAVARMRETVERLLVDAVPEAERAGVFEKLGSSLGALDLLIDMLSYQRTMARKLFVFDEDLGELRILMSRTRARATDATEEAPARLEERSAPAVLPPAPVSRPSPPAASQAPSDSGLRPAPAAKVAPAAVIPAPAAVAAAATPAPVATTAKPLARDLDSELLDVFLEEVREVVVNGLIAIDLLRAEPGNLGEQTTLRRAFHTLKGSSRMVGLNDFGEAAWSMEQVLNAWLTEKKPAQPGLLQLSGAALQAFSRWADDIAAGDAGGWQPQAFRASADAMRLDGTLLPLVLPGAASDAAPAPAPAPKQAAPASAKDQAVSDLHPTMPAFMPTMPAFMPTEMLGVDQELPAQAPADMPEMAEDIDFSVFAAALNESPAPPAATARPGAT